jgi:branched-chain amino acid aminotransferase
MPGFFIYNGKYFPDNTPVLGPDSRAFRYGDGIFETIRVARGRIPLRDYHFRRCFKGFQMLGFEIPGLFTRELLENEILELCRKNQQLDAARVRISFFRGNGGLYDPESNRPHYIIQTWALPANYSELNSNGLELIVYPPGRKSCDPFSNLKSNNALLYVMAAQYAKEQKCNEALVLNIANNIADATIANIFWIREDQIFTNPLTDGIVAGVMRQYIIDHFDQQKNPVVQESITEDQLADADEIFTTNALYGMRWAVALGNKQFSRKSSSRLYRDLVSPLFG